MSFDIVVLKLNEPIESLEALEEEPQPMGSVKSIQKAINAIFEGTEWDTPSHGKWEYEDKCILEFLIPEEKKPSSLQFILHFGPQWSDEVHADLTVDLTALYQEHGWQSFAASDNSALYIVDGIDE